MYLCVIYLLCAGLEEMDMVQCILPGLNWNVVPSPCLSWPCSSTEEQLLFTVCLDQFNLLNALCSRRLWQAYKRTTQVLHIGYWNALYAKRGLRRVRPCSWCRNNIALKTLQPWRCRIERDKRHPERYKYQKKGNPLFLHKLDNNNDLLCSFKSTKKGTWSNGLAFCSHCAWHDCLVQSSGSHNTKTKAALDRLQAKTSI